MLRARLPSLAVLALLALPPSLARATIYTQVLHAYQVHGSVPACEFSSKQLEGALKGIDTYGAQYFEDFSAAVQAALTARAGGACAPRRSEPVAATRAGGTPGGPAGTPGGPLRLGPVGAATNGALPAPILLLAALSAILAALATVATIVLWRGWSPAWGARWSHMWSEAAYRARGRWLEFTDWLRSGFESSRRT